MALRPIARLFPSVLRGLAGRKAALHVSAPLIDQLESRTMMAATVVTAIDDQSVLQNSSPLLIGLAGRYVNDISAITGSLVKFNFGSLGTVYLELFDQLPAAADPNRQRVVTDTVNNFLAYIAAGRYNDTIIHRSVSNFVLQGGGYRVPDFNNIQPDEIAEFDPIDNEAGPENGSGTVINAENLNRRGTIAMAQLGTDQNSATNQWFFNLANNTSLDTRNSNGGPYTVFGQIVGNGLNIIDRVAQISRFDANDFYGLPSNGPFNNLPLRNFGGSSPIRPENFVTLDVNNASSGELTDITYTVTSSNTRLVTTALDNGNLVLTPRAGATGTAIITVRATAADGTFVNDTFTIRVAGTPVIATLRPSVTVISSAGSPLRLTATGVVGRGATVTTVKFFLDNGDNVFDANTDTQLGEDTSSIGGFTFNVDTTGFAPNTFRFFAQATDQDNRLSNVVTTTSRVNAAPTIAGLSPAPTSVPRLTNVVLTSAGAADDTSVRSMDFYFDTNGNNAFDLGIDKRLGSGRRVSGTNDFSFSASTRGLLAGTNRFFARAIDTNGAASTAVTTTVEVTNLDPTISSIRLSTTKLIQLGRTFSVTGNSVRDRDGTISLFDVYLDRGTLGVLDVDDFLIGTDTSSSGGFRVTAAADPLNNFVVGNNQIIARVTDNNSGQSAFVSAILIINAAPVLAGPITFTPNPIGASGNYAVTVGGVSDTDGTIRRVELIRDSSGDGVFGSGDRVLGSGRLTGLDWIISNLRGSSLTLGVNKFFVRVTDNTGAVTISNAIDITVA